MARLRWRVVAAGEDCGGEVDFRARRSLCLHPPPSAASRSLVNMWSGPTSASPSLHSTSTAEHRSSTIQSPTVFADLRNLLEYIPMAGPAA